MRAYGQVYVRQSYNVPLVSVNLGTSQCFTVNTGKNTDIAVRYREHSTVLSALIDNIVGIMEYLVVIFQSLVNVVVNVMLCQLAHETVNACVSYDVDKFGEAVCSHHRVNVSENLGCHLSGNDNGVTRYGVVELVGKDLRFVSFQCCNGCFVELVRQSAANLFQLAVKVVVVTYLVVKISGWHHCKAHCKGRPNNIVKGGSVFRVCYYATARSGNGYFTVVIYHGNLHGVAHAGKRPVCQILRNNGVGRVGLFSKEIQCSILLGAGHVAVEIRTLHPPIL